MKTNTIIKKLSILFLFIAGLFQVATAQGWAKSYSPNYEAHIYDLAQRSDSTFWAYGFNLSTITPSRFMRIDQNGNIIQSIDSDSLTNGISRACLTPDQGMAMIGQGMNDFNNPNIQTKVAMRIDDLGNILWTKNLMSYVNPTSSAIGNLYIDTTDNNGFICASNIYDTTMQQNRKLVQRLDANGNILWSNYYDDSNPASYISFSKNAKDGGFILGISWSKIIKIDGNGNFEWEYNPTFLTNRLNAEASPFSNSKINIYSVDTTNYSPIIGQIDNISGNLLWLQNYPVLPGSSRINSFIEINPQTYVGNAKHPSNLSGSNKYLALAKLDTSGQVLDFKWLPTANLGHDLVLLPSEDIIYTLDKGFLVGGFHQPNNTNPYSGYLIKADSTFTVYPNSVTGFTWYDSNEDCILDANESKIPKVNVSFVSSQDSFLTRSSQAGEYALGLNQEIYNVTTSPISPYWSVSACNPQILDASQHQDTIINLAFDAILDLPYITIDAYTRPRWCSSNTYTIEYCNTGTTNFIGYLEVNIDTALQIDSASIPIVSQSGNTLFFVEPLGLGIGECKSFKIYYTIPCDNDLLERTICINAHAYNDSIASLNPLWDLSNLELVVDYQVGEDSVNFQLSNTGAGNMIIPQKLMVIEDNVILTIENKQLNAGETLSIKVPANGKTWRSFINQSIGNPYAKFTTAFIEGATNNLQTVSTGFVNQFPINGQYAFHYNFCGEVLNSYDPNQKTVYPKGLIPNKLIEANIDLEYLLEFQNTGNDVAYVVRIIDTLPPHLSPESIIPSISSHSYTFNFLSHNVVEFLFEGINLPDSTSNEAESHGFVKFRIKQKPNNPIGTEINNSVSIYFDYNDPIVTNIAQVVIGELKIVETETNIKDIELENLIISYFPNPSFDFVNIKVDGYHFNELSLSFFDMQGKIVHQQFIIDGNSFRINTSNFNDKGVYLFQIDSNKKYIGRGKIIVQ